MKHTLALLLAASLVVGCSYEERPESSGESEVKTVPATVNYDAAKFVGHWVGQTEMSDEDIAKMRETMSDQEVQGWITMINEMENTLDLFEDGTYSMLSSFMGVPVEDTWTVDGDTLTLASSGMSSSYSGTTGDDFSFDNLSEENIVMNKQPLNLSVEADGKELVMADETGEMTSRLVYTKE